MKKELMSTPDVYNSLKNVARKHGLNSDSPLACEDHCIYDAGYSCTYCDRYDNTKYFKNMKKTLEEHDE